MDNVKYTTDGKKVVVIGELNQTEKIVQEIYITESGDEIPQGERFVAKGLLDEPAKTWKEMRMEQIEIKFNNVERDWKRKMERLKEEQNHAYSSLSHRVKWLENVAKEPGRSDMFKDVINTLALFLSDREKWICFKDYKGWYIEKFDDYGKNPRFERCDDYSQVRHLRLVSLFGDTNGDLTYRVNDYSDGSGWDTYFKVFGSEEEALAFVQSVFDKRKSYDKEALEYAARLGLTIDNDKLEAFNKQEIAVIKERISDYESRIKDARESLNKYK